MLCRGGAAAPAERGCEDSSNSQCPFTSIGVENECCHEPTYQLTEGIDGAHPLILSSVSRGEVSDEAQI